MGVATVEHTHLAVVVAQARWCFKAPTKAGGGTCMPVDARVSDRGVPTREVVV